MTALLDCSDETPDARPTRDDMFLLCVDGQPMAETDPRGQKFDWI